MTQLRKRLGRSTKGDVLTCFNSAEREQDWAAHALDEAQK